MAKGHNSGKKQSGVTHTCQLSGISKSEIAYEIPIYRIFRDIHERELFWKKIKSETFFYIYRDCVIKSTKFALHTYVIKLIT